MQAKNFGQILRNCELLQDQLDVELQNDEKFFLLRFLIEGNARTCYTYNQVTETCSMKGGSERKCFPRRPLPRFPGDGAVSCAVEKMKGAKM